MNPFLPVLLTLALPAVQGLPDRFKENRAAWEENLDKGQGAPVRKATEDLLQQEGAAVNPSDYNAMHAMVAVRNLAAKACVVEGAWEDAITHLEKASQAATDNVATAEGTFAKLVTQHQEKLKEWRDETAQQEKRLQALDAQAGLTADQIKLRGQIRGFLDEHRKAIAQSEKSLKEIDGLLVLLKKEQETYAASLAEWQGFLAKERADIARLGTITPMWPRSWSRSRRTTPGRAPSGSPMAAGCCAWTPPTRNAGASWTAWRARTKSRRFRPRRSSAASPPRFRKRPRRSAGRNPPAAWPGCPPWAGRWCRRRSGSCGTPLRHWCASARRAGSCSRLRPVRPGGSC